MRKITSLVLSSMLLSYSLTGCSSQVQVEPIAEQQVQQDTSILSSINQIDKVFMAFDADKDGKVSLKEYNKTMNNIASYASDKTKFLSVTSKAFEAVDADKNQMLDKKEFANIEKELQSSSTPAVQKNSSASKATNPKVIKAAFDMLKDSDEEISDRAFMKFLAEQNGMPSQDAMKIFVSLDKSKNGRLDFKEFSKLFDKTNSFMDSVKSIASIIPLLLVAPILWVMDKVGLFNNIK